MAKSAGTAPRKLSKMQSILARVAITIAAVGFFCLLRPDVASSATRRLLSSQVISDYVKDNSVRKLQIGAGEFNKPGWLNTDIEPRDGQAYLDATKPFPLPDKSFQIVFSEQVIEHVSLEDGKAMVKESFRILAPGGKVRIATPNLLRYAELLREEKTPEQLQFIQAKVAWHKWDKTPDPASLILNFQMHEFGHQFLYTPAMLRSVLEDAGFKDIRQYESGQSDDPALKLIEVRSESNVAEIDRFETMVFEAVRP